MRSICITFFLLVLSASSAFCAIPVMGSTSEDVLYYGESPDFKAAFPFVLVNPTGGNLGSCSGSFVDVDGDVFFVTATHCLNLDDVKGVEVQEIMHNGFSNAKGLNDLKVIEKAYIQSTLRAEDFVINRQLINEEGGLTPDNKEIQQKRRQLSDVEQKNPLKILEIIINNMEGGGNNELSSYDLAFLSLDSTAIPSSVKPFKLYKGSSNQLIGEKVTAVGFGRHPSSPPSFADLFQNLGCLLNIHSCDDLKKGPMRQAGDLQIFGKMDNNNLLMVYPSNSKFASDIPVNLAFGDSGGPVLYKDENGDFSIIGVNAATRDLENQFAKINYFEVVNIMNSLRDKGSTQINFVQFIEPQILEKARFKKHGLLDAIDHKNETLLLQSIENGLLGVNHDSGSFLLKSAIDNDMREFAAELVHKGISNVYNFDILCSLAEKEIWTVFDAVLELVTHSISNAENNCGKWIRGINGFRHNDLLPYEVKTIQKHFLSMDTALKNNDRNMIRKLLGHIKEINKSKKPLYSTTYS